MRSLTLQPPVQSETLPSLPCHDCNHGLGRTAHQTAHQTAQTTRRGTAALLILLAVVGGARESAATALSTPPLAVAAPAPLPEGLDGGVVLAIPASLLDAATTGGEVIDFALEIEGRPILVNMHPATLRGPGCTAELVRPDGTRETLPLRQSTLWVGAVAGTPGSLIAATVRPEGMRAMLLLDGRLLAIEPLPRRPGEGAPAPADGSVLHVLARAEQHVALEPFICGTSEAEIAVARGGGDIPIDPRCARLWTLAIELDQAFVRASAQPTEPGAVGWDPHQAIESAECILGLAAIWVEQAVNIRTRVTRFVVAVPGDAVELETAPAAPSALYAEFWNRWSTSIRRDAHSALLFTGRPLVDRTASHGWVGGVGGGPAQSGIVISTALSPRLAFRATTAWHALLHALGAFHCDGAECGLMQRAATRPSAIGPDAPAVRDIVSLVHARDALPLVPLPGPAAVRIEVLECRGLRVSWPEVPGATRYEVLRHDRDDPLTASILASVAGTFHVVNEAPIGTPLYHWVRALNGCTASGVVSAGRISIPLGLPPITGVAAADGAACSEVALVWNGLDDAVEYEVLRNSVNNVGTAKPIARIPAAATGADADAPQSRFYSDALAPAGAVNWYWVRAIDSCGRLGPVGRGDSGFTGGPPPAPTLVSASDGSACASVIVTWSPVAGASEYAIWRAANGNLAEATQIGSSPTSPFEDEAAPLGSDLHYWVRAVNSCGTGSFGGPDRGRAVGAVPAVAPIGSAVIACGQSYQTTAPSLLNAACSLPVEWSLARGPAGLLTGGDGAVTWSAPTVGVHEVVVAARNTAGIGELRWTITVTPLAPLAGQPTALDGKCGEPLTGAAPTLANAACAGAITWTLEGGPAGFAVTPAGQLVWPTPTLGTHQVALVASNATGAARVAAVVQIAPSAPVVASIPPLTGRAGTPLESPPLAVANLDCTGAVRWSLATAPEGMTLDAEGRVRWPNPVPGTYAPVVTATSEHGSGSTPIAVRIEAALPKEVPVLAEIDDAECACGAAWQGPLPTVVNLEKAGTVRFSLDAAPAGATIDESGVVRLTTSTAGTYAFTIAVQGEGGRDDESWALHVRPDAPMAVAQPDVSTPCGTAATPLTLQVANASCAGALAWLLTRGPPGMAIDQRGTLTWRTPTLGRHAVTATATGGAGIASWQFTLELKGPLPPAIDPMGDIEIAVGSEYTSEKPGLVDAACAGTVIWSLSSAPEGVVIDAEGVVRWPTPVVGEHTLTITAANSAGETAVSWKVVVRAAPPPASSDGRVVNSIGDG